MPLDKVKSEQLITIMRTMDVQKRLDAINEARVMFRNTFKDNMTDADWAFSAYIIETFYNLIKDELKQGIQERIGKAAKENGIIAVQAKEKKESKVKKNVPKTMDIASLMAGFAAFQNQNKG